MEQLATIVAAIPPPGEYFSTVKIVVLLVLVVPWLYAASWVNKDTLRVHMPQTLWSVAVLGGPLAALVLLALIPVFAVGLLLYLASAGGLIGAYVVLRNRRVGAEKRVLTSGHVRHLFKPAKPQKVDVVQRVKLYDSHGRPSFPPPEDQADRRAVFNLTQDLFHDVVMLRASEVDVSPAGEAVAVRYVVDGVVQQRPGMSRSDAEEVIDFIKELAGLNVQDKRRPQKGKIGLEMGAVSRDVAVTTTGTNAGQRVQMRIVQEAARTSLDELGMPDDLRARLEDLNTQTGLLIVAGPGGSGVTSTLYSLLRRHDAFMTQLATVEVNPVVELENVTQQRYTDQVDLPAKLASLLRRDPNVVMVDRCETNQAAALVAEAAAAKNVLLGAAAENSFVALAKWIKVVGDAGKAVAPLKAISCQVLLRTLCPTCREAYRPSREMLAKLNVPAEKIDKFYRPPTQPMRDEKGNPMVCPTCRGTAYLGRSGAFELLEMTDEIRELIVQNAPLARIKAACRKNRMLYLQEQGLRKVFEGVTSIDEVIRVSKAK